MFAALVILTVICTVLMGFQVLLGALQDAAAARVLHWIGLGGMILLVIDVFLLVGALAMRVLEQDRNGSNDS